MGADVASILLRKLEHFATLSEGDRRLLERHEGRVLHLGPRQSLLQEGDDPRNVHVVLDGWACRYKQLEDGRRQIISLCVPGDLCEPTIVLLPTISHGFCSLTSIRVSRFAHDEILQMFSESPSLERAFLIEMLVGSEMQREWTFNVGRRTAVERMAHLFCEIPMRLAAVGLSNGAGCDLPLTQADLGDILALSTVHVNRTLQDLRSTGFVELKGRHLTINNLPGLRAVAMFDPAYLHLADNPSR